MISLVWAIKNPLFGWEWLWDSVAEGPGWVLWVLFGLGSGSDVRQMNNFGTLHWAGLVYVTVGFCICYIGLCPIGESKAKSGLEGMMLPEFWVKVAAQVLCKRPVKNMAHFMYLGSGIKCMLKAHLWVNWRVVGPGLLKAQEVWLAVHGCLKWGGDTLCKPIKDDYEECTMCMRCKDKKFYELCNFDRLGVYTCITQSNV
ncbi:hypothetical protein Hanom_Chr12g01066741 [Helianthus anomalus]